VRDVQIDDRSSSERRTVAVPFHEALTEVRSGLERDGAVAGKRLAAASDLSFADMEFPGGMPPTVPAPETLIDNSSLFGGSKRAMQCRSWRVRT